MSPASSDELVLARQSCGISQEDLWMRYFALGGMRQPLELDAIVHDALHTSALDRDLVVLALNERFNELGRASTIPYSDEPPDVREALGPVEPEASRRVEHTERVDGAKSPHRGQRAADTPAERDSRRFRRLADAQPRYAYRDALTGVLTRDAGRDQLQQAVDQAHRTKQPLALVFIDVDHLKRTNDSQGHAAGDFLLTSLGGALRQGLRSYDVVVRYGGDEFVCGLPRAGLLQATRRVDRVSAQLAADVPGAALSAGFAALRQEESLEDVLGRADEDMYSTRCRQRSEAPADAAAVDVTRRPFRARLNRFLRPSP